MILKCNHSLKHSKTTSTLKISKNKVIQFLKDGWLGIKYKFQQIKTLLINSVHSSANKPWILFPLQVAFSHNKCWMRKRIR